MFCGECGTKNTSGSKFCENCGAKLEQPTNVQQQEQTINHEPNQQSNISQPVHDTQLNANQAVPANVPPAKPMDKKTKTIIGLVVAIIAVLSGAYYYVGTLVTPEKIAENYFNAVVEQDAEKIYNLMRVEDSTFTSKKMFKKVFKNTASKDSKVTIVNYEVGKPKYDDLTKLSTTVTITFVAKDAEKSTTMDIKLSKSKDKKWFLYDNWLVTPEEFSTATDFQINVAKDATVTVEGEKLGNKYLDKESSSETQDVYVIPTMFSSKYKIKVDLPIEIETEETVNVYTNGYYYPSFGISTLTKKSKTKLEEKFQEDLKILYDAAIAKKTFDEIKSNFEYKDADLTTLADEYNNFVAGLDTEVVLTKIDFSEPSLYSLSVNSDNEIYIAISTKTAYTVTYQYGGETKTHDDTSTEYMSLEYKYVDGEYKLIDIVLLETYFSRY